MDEGEFTEGHELDRKWKVAKQMIGRRLSQEEAKRLLAKIGMKDGACFDVRYEGFIGAKKHLVLGSLSYIGPPQGKNSVAIG